MRQLARRALLALLLAVPCAFAQTAYPSRPVQLIIGFPPGSGSDAVARIVAQRMSTELGQPLVVMNRAGASGIIASDAVAKSAPDGYTLFLGSASSLTFNTASFAKLPYDPVADFAPIGMIGKQPFVIAVNPNLPVKTLAEFVALARSQPGKLTYGNTGSSAELAQEFFDSVAGIKLLGVPYKGGAVAAGSALMTGEIDTVMDPSVTIYPQVGGKKPTLLAVTSTHRSPFQKDLPTVAESGFANFEVSTWWALLAPARTPQPILDLLADKLKKTLADDEVKQQLARRTVEIETSTPQQLHELIVSEGQRWRETARKAGIKPE